eukprot:TRINITY_DN8510_c0_g1_i1.p1 TRINITY_DN8510_c0_g1~~TRINITY_DN8510_c0_g1_i1.p1  ORF type:complete len:326 (+),score=72.54 TRINITY_DN8510_c0_g1_i1:143-1120(+)
MTVTVFHKMNGAMRLVPPEPKHVDRFYIPGGSKSPAPEPPPTFDELQEQIRESNRVIKVLEKQVASTTAGHQQLLGRLDAADDEKTTLELQHHSSESEVKRLSAELNICESEKSILANELKTKNVIIEDLQRELRDLSNTLLKSDGSSKNQVETLQQELVSKDALITKLQALLDTNESELQCQQSTVSEITLRMRELERSTQTRSEETQTYIEKLRHEAERYRTQISELSTGISNKSEEIAVLQASNAQWLKQYRKLKKELQNQTSQLEYIKNFEGDAHSHSSQQSSAEIARIRYREVAFTSDATPVASTPRMRVSFSGSDSITK